MSKSKGTRYTEEQILRILRELESGRAWRRYVENMKLQTQRYTDGAASMGEWTPHNCSDCGSLNQKMRD
jgi:hypothetical protein